MAPISALHAEPRGARPPRAASGRSRPRASPSSSSSAARRRRSRDHRAAEQQAGHVGDEEDPLGAEADRERGRRPRRRSRSAAPPRAARRRGCGPRASASRSRRGGRDAGRRPARARARAAPEADLVAEERQARGPIAAQTVALTAASDSRTTASASRRRDAAAADELDRQPAPLHLLGDLRPGAVDDDRPRRPLLGEGEHRADRLAADRAAELDHDPASRAVVRVDADVVVGEVARQVAGARRRRARGRARSCSSAPATSGSTPCGAPPR